MNSGFKANDTVNMEYLDERALLDGLREGDETAYRHLISKYKAMVFGLIYRMIPDEEEAKDLSQDVFVQVWESIGGFKGQSSIKTWVYTIAFRKALNRIRSKKTSRMMFFGEKDVDKVLKSHVVNRSDGYEMLRRKEMYEQMQAAVNKLPPHQKAAFILSKTQGFSDAETAAIMDTTIGAVESLLVRARKKLKEELISMYNEMRYEK